MKLLEEKVIKRYISQYYKFLLLGLFLILFAFLFPLFELDLGFIPFVLFCFGIFIIAYYLYKLIKNRISVMNLDDKLVKEITGYLDKYKYVVYDDMGVICFDKYFINMSKGFEIVKYSDIERCFYKKNIFTSSVICYVLKDGNKGKIRDLLLNLEIDSVNGFMQYIRKCNNKIEVYSVRKFSDYIKKYYFKKNR